MVIAGRIFQIDLFVGNLSEDINVDSDESAGFTANAIMYRGVAVFDSQPAKTDAFVRLVSTT